MLVHVHFMHSRQFIWQVTIFHRNNNRNTPKNCKHTQLYPFRWSRIHNKSKNNNNQCEWVSEFMQTANKRQWQTSNSMKNIRNVRIRCKQFSLNKYCICISSSLLSWMSVGRRSYKLQHKEFIFSSLGNRTEVNMILLMLYTLSSARWENAMLCEQCSVSNNTKYYCIYTIKIEIKSSRAFVSAPITTNTIEN